MFTTRLDDDDDDDCGGGSSGHHGGNNNNGGAQLNLVPKSQRAKLRRRWWRTGRCSSSSGQNPEVPIIILDGQSSEDRDDDEIGRIHSIRSSPYHFRRSVCYGVPLHDASDGWVARLTGHRRLLVDDFGLSVKPELH